jgi:uncharacterized protein
MQEPLGQHLKCPKCPGTMRSYQRNGVQIEQCDSCRGVFLDFGELEALSRMEAQYAQQPPQYQQPYPPQGPAWGGHGGYHHGHHRKSGWGGLFFSS